MSSNFLNDENKGDIIIYQSESGETKIDVRFQDETVWLTQAQLCELYQSSKANVSEHIKNIFEEGELEQSAVVRKIRTTAADGKTYAVNHYNLDMIISLGYRIKSSIATQFRRWANHLVLPHSLYLSAAHRREGKFVHFFPLQRLHTF